MSEGELLRTIETTWLTTAKKRVSGDASASAAVGEMLQRFFDHLVQALDNEDPTCLEPVISDWCADLTESDLEGQPSSLIPFLKEIMTATGQACLEGLDAVNADRVIRCLVPHFAHAFERASQHTIEARVAFSTSELDSVRQNLERLDRSKSDFISVAAHELKTPLTLIEGYTAMLSEALGDRSNVDPERTLLQGIHQGSQRLQTIIDDMIDVSLIDNRLLALHFQPVWIDRLFNRLADELRLYLEERKQALVLNLSDAGVPMTYADPERLTQAFRQVLLNAIKFTPDGGKIAVSSRALSGFLEIQVADTGIGIDPEDQSFIFEKFSRLGSPTLHSSGKTKFKGGGPGLGLHITRGILEAHGGSVWVESAGQNEESCPGSTFHFLLPLRSEPPETKFSRLYEPHHPISPPPSD